MRRAACLLLVLAIAACTRVGSPEDASRTPRTAPAGRPMAAPPPPDGSCRVEYGLRVDGYTVTATARNRGDQDVTVELADRCPAAPIALLGLPAGYDADRTCNMGACAGRASAEARVVGAGQTIELTRWTIDPAAGTCNGALPAATYTLSFAPPPVVGGGGSCGPASAELAHAPRAAKRKPAPRREPEPDPEPPRCPPMPACGIGCPNGVQAHDENGCSLCACEDLSPIEAPRPR